MPELCLPQRKPVFIEDLVLRSATEESVSVYLPSRSSGRAGRHMWVSAADRTQWEEIVGERTAPPAAPVEEDDDVITFAEQEVDRSCRAGEDGWCGSDARPLRDLDQPTSGFPLLRLPVQRSDADHSCRADGSPAALGCPPWELGLCAGCSQMMRRRGENAAMYCNVCRAILNRR